MPGSLQQVEVAMTSFEIEFVIFVAAAFTIFMLTLFIVARWSEKKPQEKQEKSAAQTTSLKRMAASH